MDDTIAINQYQPILRIHMDSSFLDMKSISVISWKEPIGDNLSKK